MSDLANISVRGIVGRIAILLLAVLAVTLAFFGIRWQLGNMIATLTSPSDFGAAELASVAVRWAPADPAVRSFLAETEYEPTRAVAELENALRLAPNDHRWRVSLGRALALDEQPARAEFEVKRATDLAPTYAMPRWHLANFYLRSGRSDEALEQLRIAARDNPAYRDQAYSLVWDYFGKDPAKVEDIAGDNVGGIVRSAYFFASRGYGAEAARVWERLDEQHRSVNQATAKAIAHGLFMQKRFSSALVFARASGIDAEAERETITNGSFERTVGDQGDARFGWRVDRIDPKFEAIPDGRVQRNGNRALRLTFRGYSRPTLANISQTVVVEPSTGYSLRFYVRTEALRGAGLPRVAVLNARDNRLIAQSAVFPASASDWLEVSISLSTPTDCEAIDIVTTREPCGDECPITGTVWYDDFELIRSQAPRID